MSRTDLTDSLIHFVRAPSDGEAYQILSQIARDRALRGSSGCIKGGYTCVCFADLSISLAKAGLVNSAGKSRYTRFGVMVPKEWLFEQGGRPVIYQPENEFALLPETHRWRHMTFDLGENRIDFTWEREWRIPCEWLPLDPSTATLIVPHQKIAEQLVSDHEREQDYQVQLYSLIVDDLAEQYRQDFDWSIRALRWKRGVPASSASLGYRSSLGRMTAPPLNSWLTSGRARQRRIVGFTTAPFGHVSTEANPKPSRRRNGCTSPEKTETEIWLTNTVSGLTRTLHFIQGRNPA